MSYSGITLKKLFALSGNQCAFPDCTAPIVDTATGVVVGEICHIKGRSLGGPRHDPNQLDRDSYENLILMCGAHNKIIDDKRTRDNFPEEKLYGFKYDHEARFANSVVDPVTQQAFVGNWLGIEGSVITTYNQSGGQAAQSILNILTSQPVTEKAAKLVPVIESHMTGADNQIGLDRYNLNIALRNDGNAVAREWRIEVEIPNEFKQSGSGAVCEVSSHGRGAISLFCVTEQERPNLIFYPGSDASLTFLLLDYEVRVSRYETISRQDVIRFKTFAGDALPTITTFPICDYLSEDRCRQLWSRNEDRPEALRHPRKYFPQP